LIVYSQIHRLQVKSGYQSIRWHNSSSAIYLRSAYVTQFLVQRISGMHSALWDTFGSMIHCLNLLRDISTSKVHWLDSSGTMTEMTHSNEKKLKPSINCCWSYYSLQRLSFATTVCSLIILEIRSRMHNAKIYCISLILYLLLTNSKIAGNTTFNIVTQSFQFTSSRYKVKNPFNQAVIPVKYRQFFLGCSWHDCTLQSSI
jgi:hypothetical protein